MTTPSEVVPADSAGCRVLVVVGTDFHPFDRLITWTNEWLGSRQEMAGRCFVQSGTASVSPACDGSQFLEVGELCSLFDAADVIISHGGPATIFEAWARGRRPIVVPRLARHREHVDDHQSDFCEKVSELGRISVARTLADFIKLVDEAVADPSRFRIGDCASSADDAVGRLSELVSELVGRPGRPRFFVRGQRAWPTPEARTGDTAARGGPTPDLVPVVSTNRQAASTVHTGLAATVKEEQE